MVYTLDNLPSGARLAVIGNPVAHSLSPEMHNPALQAAGIDTEYIRVLVENGDVKAALIRFRDAGFIGINCTVPHKFDALESVDHLDPQAARLGAVNTVVFRPDGTAAGFNTDGPGFVRAIAESFGRKLGDLRVLILGAGGGAGRAVAVQCATEGVPGLALANRTTAKAEAVASEISEYYPAGRISVSTLQDISLTGIDLIINATSNGMKPSDPELLSASAFLPTHLVSDMIYSPPETKLLTSARAAGAKSANGLPMLIHQGAIAFEHWFPGAPDPTDAMRQGITSALSAS